MTTLQLAMAQGLDGLGAAQAHEVQKLLAGATGRPVNTTFLHQAAPAAQPHASAMAAQRVQIINAYNADGQPVTIAINPNGTHTILQQAHNNAGLQMAAAAAQQQQQQQQQQLRAATLVPAQGHRLVQLPTGELQAVPIGPSVQQAIQLQSAQPGIYKVVQQGGAQALQQQPAQGGRIVYHQAHGQQVQQLYVAQAGAQPTTLQTIQMRAAPGNGFQPSQQAVMVGLPNGQTMPVQMQGRSLVHIGTRPNTVTTYNPTTGMRTSSGTAPGGVLHHINGQAVQQQAVMLQNGTIVMQQVGGGSQASAAARNVLGGGGNGLVMQPQVLTMVPGPQQQQVAVQVPAPSMQQQAKDTVAQQRQQQLLASLRAQLSNMQGGGGGGAAVASAQPAPAPVQPKPPVLLAQPHGMQLAVGAGTVQQQLQRAQAVGGKGQTQAMPAQGLLAAQNTQTVLMHNVTNYANNHHRLTGTGGLLQQHQLQQPGMHTLSSASTFETGAGLPRGSMGHGASSDGLDDFPGLTLGSLMDGGGGGAAGQHASLGSAQGGSSRTTPPPAGGMRSISSDSAAGLLGAELNSAYHSTAQPSPHNTAATLPGTLSKGHLDNILYSIGVELARHGFTVAQAIEAGWLGVLSDTDIAMLQDAYRAEERAMGRGAAAGEAASPAEAGTRAYGSPAPSAMSSLSGYPSGYPTLGGAPQAPFGSTRRSSASEDRPATAGSPRSSGNPAAPSLPPVAAAIDDACFSAFAYDFFGAGAGDNSGVGLDAGLLVALEAGDSLSGGPTSSAAPALPAQGSSRASDGSLAGLGVAGGKSSASASVAGDMSAAADSAPPKSSSWPLGGAVGGAHSLGSTSSHQATPSVGVSFNDAMCAPPAAAAEGGMSFVARPVSRPSSMHDPELVARISNLDLGCGFY